jgi:L-methionine (R)-S-oxide reductase
MTDELRYRRLLPTLGSLLTAYDKPITNLANCASAIYHEFEKMNWVGFYLFDGKDLYLGPFHGKPACARIELGKGVCGTAALERRAIVVPDVDKFPGHIACDSASRSEIVIPIVLRGALYGVLDADAPEPDAFGDVDREYLGAVVELLADGRLG